MEKSVNLILKIVTAIVVILFLVAVFAGCGWLFMFFWNWLVVAIFPNVIRFNWGMGIGAFIFLTWIASWFKSSKD